MKTTENSIDVNAVVTKKLQRQFEEETGLKAIDYTYPQGQVVETYAKDYVNWLEKYLVRLITADKL